MYLASTADETQSATYQTGYAIGTALGNILMFMFVAAIVFSVICASMAQRRGRSVGLAIFGGFIFGLFAVIYYLIAGDSVEKRVIREEVARAKYHAATSHTDQP